MNTITDDPTKNHTIIIDAKRWFQRTYGNTYHSVKVYVDNKLIGKVNYTYGYGDSYLQTAHELLVKAGYFTYEIDDTMVEGKFISGKPSGAFHYKTYDNKNESYSNFLNDMREHRERYHITCVDVQNKRDL